MRPIFACLWCWLLLAGSLFAQQPSAPAAPPVAEPAPLLPPVTAPPTNEGAVQLLEPDTFLLPDQEGELQTILRFPFEEFIEAVKIKNEIDGPQQQPRYSLQEFKVTGAASDQHAQLRLEFTILVRTSNWIRVPLGLPQIVLREPVQYEGPGEQFLHFDQEQDGYVSWLRSEPNTTHQLVLEVLVPLVKLGSESALQLGAPRATASSFAIDVSEPRAVGRLADSNQKLTTEHRPNITHFSGIGVGGEFELAWRSGDRPAAKVPIALEASGLILARIDGRSVRSEARLTVRSFGGEFDQFRVRLPPGAELVAGAQPGYSLAPVEETTGKSKSRLVDVKLDHKSVGPVEVRLVTEQSRELAGADREVELAGFEVVNAIRQWGHLAVEVIGDWQVLWGDKRNMRQVEDLPESLRRDDLVAGFEYFSQPCSLPARVIPRTTRVRVEPEYLLSIGARQASLEARLRYSVRGAKVFSFEIRMHGWEVEAINPSNVVDVDAIVVSDQGIVSIPLLQPTTGQVELVLKARCELGEQAKEVALELPVPEATSQTPSTLIVLADDNVELTVLTEKLSGLTPMQIAPRVKLPVRQQAPLYFRGEADPALFAAALEVHVQEIASRVASVVQLESAGGRVEQALSYRVEYEPIDKLTLAVPRRLAQPGAMQISFEGQSLSLVAVTTDAAAEDTPSETVLMRAALPQARIGNCELLVSFPLTTPEVMPQQSIDLRVPLVMPVDTVLEGNQVLVQPAPGLRVSHRKGAWSETEPEQTTSDPQRGLHLEAEASMGELPLAVQAEQRLSPGSTVVYRAWLQTWLTSTARQDRICYRFTSNEDQLTLRLPVGVEPRGIECVLDAALVPVELGSERTLTIPLPPQASGRRRQLELRYNFRERRGGSGLLTIAAPQLQGGILIESLSTQLILPRHEHLIAAPDNLIPEFRWGWQDFYWGRHPLRSQSQLESWVGATAGAQPPPATNAYLFSALRIPAELQFRTATRGAIMLFCSGAVLIAGLVLLYVPASRQSGVLFGAAVLLLAVGVLYPEPVLLAAQAAVLGLILVLIAGLLKRFAGRRCYEVPSPGASSLSAPGRSTLEGAPRVPSAAPSSATSTVALHTSEANG